MKIIVDHDELRTILSSSRPLSQAAGVLSQTEREAGAALFIQALLQQEGVPLRVDSLEVTT